MGSLLWDCVAGVVVTWGLSVKPKKQTRPFVMFVSLVGVLTLTSALLLALAPAPLTPDTTASLQAVGEAKGALDVVFKTRIPTVSGRWKSIYIHHSQTVGGNATSLAREGQGLDSHFLIGNGDGANDGEIQVTQRWSRQLPPAAPDGASSISAEAVSICLVGNLEQTVPTPLQIRRLEELVRTLQSRLDISAEQVQFFDTTPRAAGIGRFFPARAFREQLVR